MAPEGRAVDHSDRLQHLAGASVLLCGPAGVAAAADAAEADMHQPRRRLSQVLYFILKYVGSIISSRLAHQARREAFPSFREALGYLKESLLTDHWPRVAHYESGEL